MAIGVLFDFPGVKQAQYDAVLKKLTKGGTLKSLNDWPVKGVLMHVAGPTPDGWRVVDVWESEAEFMKFGGVLMPILNEMKFPQTKPQIFPAHKFVKS